MSPRPLRTLLIGFAWLVVGGSSFVTRGAPDAVADSAEYVMQSWDTEDGLPHDTVMGIAQTPDGYLWIATQAGLGRFDGVRFTSFVKRTTPGLESSYSRAVFVDRTGSLWIGLERGGVARMKGGRFEVIIPVAPPDTRTRFATSFAEDAEGAVWIGMAPEQTVFCWRKGHLTKFTSDDGVGPGEDTYVHADAAGRIWFATKLACGLFDGSRFRPVDPQGGERVHLTPARDGSMWAVRGTKLLRYTAGGSRLEVADITSFGGALEINALFEDRSGVLWLATRGAGLLRLAGGKFSHVTTIHQSVHSIFEGRDGNLWAGTAAGLNRVRPQRFFLRGAAQGILKEIVMSICEDIDGRIWVAARDAPPLRGVDASNRFFSAPEGWPGGSVVAMCADPTGGVWLGYDGSPLQRWRDGAFAKIGPGVRVSTLLCARAGDVWIATIHEGLMHLRGEAAVAEPRGSGLNLVRALAEDSTGAIWAGTENGLVFRRTNERFQRIPLPETKGGESIRFFATDGEDVWIGARDAGLFRWRAGRIDHLPSSAGLPTNDLRALVIDPTGDFWLAVGRGLVRTSRRDLEAVLAGRQRLLRRTSYGRGDGLPKVGFTFGRRNASLGTRDGRIWFATDRGALTVSPEPLPESEPLAPVLLEEVLVDQQPIPLPGGGPLVLPPGPGPLEIRYTAPHLTAPERLRFRYRLVGLEESWTSTQTERTATYVRLPAGHYRFEVAVSEGDDAESPSSLAVLPITVRAAWWETALFRGSAGIIAVAAVAALVWMIVLRRVRARIRRLEQEHALERERSRIARDMHDDLGASLTRIALMSEIAADEPEMRGAAAHHLGEIAQAARAVSGTLDQIVWTVNPRNDTLERLVGYLAEFTGEYLAPTGLNLHFDLPVEMPEQIMPAEARHEMLLATKEALNNIVKYAQAKSVTLRVTTQGQTLEVLISDDGCGFDAEAVSAFSNGLLNLRQRLAAVGGSADIATQPGAGTTVTLRLPLPG